MIHEKYENVEGAITIELELEDWVWLCNLLSLILNDKGADKYMKEDTKHLLDILEDSETGIFLE